MVAAVVLGGGGYLLYWLTTHGVFDQLYEEVDHPSAPIEQPQPVEPKRPARSKPLAVKPVPPEPRFSFYTLLPEKEITLPEGEVRARKRAESLGRVQPTDYFIQVGSFYSLDEANLVQAKLSRLGIKARLEKAEIGKVLWYRVRVGPFASLREADAIRAKLRQQQIDSVVQTVKR